MFEELLAKSKGLAKAGNLVGARETCKKLEEWAFSDDESVSMAQWSSELAELENADFMASLEPKSELGNLPPKSAPTRHETAVEDRTVLSGPPDAAVRAAAAAPVQPNVVVFVHPAAMEPVPVVTPASIPKVAEPPAAAMDERPQGGFRDSRLEAFIANPGAGVLGAQKEPEVAVAGPTAEGRTAAPQKSKTMKKGVFRPEVLVVLGAIGAVAIVLKPWRWGAGKANTAQAMDRDSKYPDLSFRQSKVDPVTPEAVRARFGQKKEPPKPEFSSSLPAKAVPPPQVADETPLAVAQNPQPALPVAALPDGSEGPAATVRPRAKGTRGAHPGGGGARAQPASRPAAALPEEQPAVRAAATVAAVPTASGVPTTAENPPARRRGSRYYAAPEEEGQAVGAKPTGVQALGLPLNTRIRAELQIGISSTKHDAVVLARVLAPIKVGEKVVVPKGALLKGRSSNDNERVYIKFSEIVIGKEKFALEASAVEGDLPGVKAQKREATLEERQQSRIAQGALGAVADVALTAAGAGIAGTALRGVTSGAVQETQQAQQYDTSAVLMVPARTPVEVVVLE